MKKRPLTPVILLTIILAAGCDEDKRLVQLAQEADQRQAGQNHEIARQNQQIAEATKQLVEADAKARQELVGLERDLQAEKAEVGRQRDELERERRQIAQARDWDSAAAKAVDGAAAFLAAILPLIICAYLLYHMARGNADEVIAEVLVGEIASGKPVLLPPPEATRLALEPPQTDQFDGPDGQKEGST
jgi:hypothetical protein